MRIRFVLSLAILVSAPKLAIAGAWLEDPDNGQSITTLRFYYTDKYFDKNGNLISIEPFTKTELESYFEYGLTPDITLGGDVDFAGVTNGAIKGVGFDDEGISYGDIFARAYLYKGENFVASIEPGLDVPIQMDADLSSDGSRPIPELKLDFGYGFDAYGQHDFLDTSIKYRKRGDDGLNDMIKAEATLGIGLTDQYMIYLQASREQTFGVNDTPGNYNLTKPQISLLYNQDERFSHQVGVFADVQGDNIGAGYGLFYSFWYNF